MGDSMTEGMNHRIDANIIGSAVNEPFRTNRFIGPTDGARSLQLTMS
jgi:hypothetical protein